MVTAAEFLSAAKRVSVKPVTVAGMALHVRGLTGGERQLLRERAVAKDPMQATELVGLAVCHEDGTPFFTAEQVAELAQVDGQVVEELAQAILEASGLIEKAQDDAVKN